MNYKKLLIRENEDLISAMKQMDAGGEAILFVSDDDENLLGSITDGDIRRRIIKDATLKGEISSVYNSDPICVIHPYEISEVKELMTRKKIEVIPVVNKNNKILDVITWTDIFTDLTPLPSKKQLDLPVVIMAGGKGTRLSPFTKVLPKPLIPINDKTIMEIIIDSFIPYGIQDFYMTVFHKHKIIKSYFDELSPDYNVEYTYEPKPLGTAGSLKLLTDKIDKTFIVTNCDIVVKADIADIVQFHEAEKNEVTIVASLKNFQIPYGVCEIENGGALDCINEKPEYNFLISTGLYIMNPSVMEIIPANEFFHATDLVEKLKSLDLKVGVYPVNEKSWIDIGEWTEYKKALKELQL